MRKMTKIFLVFLLCLGLAGCATAKVLPLHDEVLVYPLSYDLTYLRVMETLDAQKGWQLEITDKPKGLIEIRNIQYTRLDDADKRDLTFLIKRVDRKHTSVELAPGSQRRLNGGDMMKAIAARLSAEV